MPSSSRPSRSVSSASLASSSTRRETPVRELSPAEKEKSLLIASACNDGDISALVKLATSSHGLVSDSLRRTAWPLLLACPAQESNEPAWNDLPPHPDEGQVALDVNRAFVYYPKHETDKQLGHRKEELSNVIVEVLRRHPALCYFQGYHDIVQVFLLVLGASEAPAPVARLSLLRIRDFMLSSLDPAISHLELLHPILHTADPDLYDHLPKSQPSFALAGTITMFAHNIQEYANITRLFDFFLAHHTVMPIYFFAAVVLSRREELLDIEKDEVDIMHAILGKLPQPFDVEFHIARAVELYERLRPEAIGGWAWWKISTSSVLKTSATPIDLKQLSLKDGEKYLQHQEKEVRRQQALKRAAQNVKYVQKRLWYYRRQGTFSLAVLVGMYAIWLGRNGGLGTRYTNFGPAGDFLKRIFSAFM